jgi:Uma2 family endonuclease
MATGARVVKYGGDMALDTRTLAPGERLPMSWEEYQALGDRVRGEYIDGELVVMNQPTGRHQDVCVELYVRIKPVLPAGVKARLSWGWKPGADEFGPDLIVFDDNGEDLRYTEVPHLVVEVLSSDPAADTVRKMQKYAAAGLPRYWIIDPEGPELFVFELDQEGGFRAAGSCAADAVVDLDIGPARVSFRVGDLLG